MNMSKKQLYQQSCQDIWCHKLSLVYQLFSAGAF